MGLKPPPPCAGAKKKGKEKKRKRREKRKENYEIRGDEIGDFRPCASGYKTEAFKAGEGTWPGADLRDVLTGVCVCGGHTPHCRHEQKSVGKKWPVGKRREEERRGKEKRKCVVR